MPSLKAISKPSNTKQSGNQTTLAQYKMFEGPSLLPGAQVAMGGASHAPVHSPLPFQPEALMPKPASDRHGLVAPPGEVLGPPPRPCLGQSHPDMAPSPPKRPILGRFLNPRPLDVAEDTSSIKRQGAPWRSTAPQKLTVLAGGTSPNHSAWLKTGARGWHPKPPVARFGHQADIPARAPATCGRVTGQRNQRCRLSKCLNRGARCFTGRCAPTAWVLTMAGLPGADFGAEADAGLAELGQIGLRPPGSTQKPRSQSDAGDPSTSEP